MRQWIASIAAILAAPAVLADPVAGPAAAPGGFNYMSIGFLAVFIIIFYFLMIRPQMKRSKEMRTMMSQLAKGDEVVTTGGMLGKISKIGDNFIELTIAENVDIKIQKQAIANVMPKGTVKSA